MPKTIAALHISYKDIISSAFDKKRLYQTRNDQNGVLNRLLGYIKSENPVSFSTKNVVLGKETDNYILLYYYDGIRYKVMKTGQVFVSSADAEENHEKIETEMTNIVKTIIADELVQLIRNTLQGTETKLGKQKTISNGEQNAYQKVLIGALHEPILH